MLHPDACPWQPAALLSRNLCCQTLTCLLRTLLRIRNFGPDADSRICCVPRRTDTTYNIPRRARGKLHLLFLVYMCESNDLACTLHATFELFVPLATVAATVAGVALSRTSYFSKGGLLSDFTTREDEEEDELLDGLDAGGTDALDVGEATPLLAKKRSTPQGRTVASVVLLLVGLFELCIHLVLYLRAAVSDDTPWLHTRSLISLIIWVRSLYLRSETR
ncbi:hypothetical protein EXIGLDRAFT_340723 [Exidia glandulosa HHB12029]|uniref:Uncharacterized protein n=1 Tax=Exidia glandulosa HHB12029 TaxID=1314781 RepID=A0A165CIC8_EXIGL|nr:hypothetical protein EXIGLDRAFT_340723 [Exidia glandulosa HHB12029]